MRLSSEAPIVENDQPSGSSRLKWVGWILVVVITIIACGVLLTFFGNNKKREAWISDAESLAAAYLQDPANRPVVDPRMPAQLHPNLGNFKQLSGAGHGGAVWNIQGYEYLSADRLAHFDRGDAEVRLIVTEGRITNPGSHKMEIQDVHWQHGAYTIPNGWRTIFTISHPELK